MNFQPLRIATWNVDRSGIRRKDRIAGQLAMIRKINPHILVFTETHESLKPDELRYAVSSKPVANYHQPGESCVAIWSKFQLRNLQAEINDSGLTACVELQLPDCVPVIVYGTIITYGADRGNGSEKPWTLHRKAVKDQSAEWAELKDRFPNHWMIVAGDFNENLNSKRWYGVKDAKQGIRDGLKAAGLACPTAAEDLDVFESEGPLSRCTVDHICVPASGVTVLRTLAWEGTIGGRRLSDHNGVFVDIDADTALPT